MSKRKYYITDSDFVYAEENEKIYIYNYTEKNFVPVDNVTIDPIKWHEFDESELDFMLRQNSALSDLL